MRRLNEILLVLPVLLLVGGKAGAQQQNVQLTKCTADPVLIVANTDFPVLFTATTVNGPATVEVQRLKADGSVDATLGKLLDDGMAPDQKKDDGIYTGRLNVRVPAGPAPLRIAATAKGETVTCNLEAALIAVEVNSLLSTLQSTRNAASGSRPTAGNSVTVNRDVAFVPPAADVMVSVHC